MHFQSKMRSYVLQFPSILSYFFDNNVLLCLDVIEIFNLIFAYFSSTFSDFEFFKDFSSALEINC